MSTVSHRLSFGMEDISDLHFEDHEASVDHVIDEEDLLLKQFQEEAELCCQDERTEDELTAAVAMMLLHYQPVGDAHNTPKNKPINNAQVITSHRCRSSPTRSLHGAQKTNIDAMKQRIRKNRRSNSNKSSLLASCRNILKEFLAQNSL